MVEDWIQDRRYSVALALVIISSFVILLPIAGYFGGLLTQSEVDLTLTVFSSLGPILLAIATFVTLLDNRILVEERIKERKKTTQKTILLEIIIPAIETIERNNSKIHKPNFEWINEDGLHAPTLHTALPPDSSVSRSLAKEEYPELYASLQQYDQSVFDMKRSAGHLVNMIYAPISAYIESNDVRHDSGELAKTEEAINEVITMSFSSTRPDWIEPHYDELRDIVRDGASPEYNEFREDRLSFSESGSELKDVLIGFRDEIIREYPISPKE